MKMSNETSMTSYVEISVGEPWKSAHKVRNIYSSQRLCGFGDTRDLLSFILAHEENTFTTSMLAFFSGSKRLISAKKSPRLKKMPSSCMWISTETAINIPLPDFARAVSRIFIDGHYAGFLERVIHLDAS